MAEMTWTGMWIGGPVPALLLSEFKEIVTDQGWETGDDSDVDGALARGEKLFLQGEQNYGNVPELEEFCHDHGLTYCKTWDAKPGAFDAGVVIWNPTLENPIERGANDQGDAVVTASELKEKLLSGKGLDDVIAELEQFETSKVPTLTLQPAPADAVPIGA